MPIAKELPQPVATPKPVAPAILDVAVNHSWDGVPIDIFRHFNTEISTIPKKDIQELRDITEWAKSKVNEPTIGNILQKISEVQQRIGSPSLNQRGYNKVWEFIKLQKIADDAIKRQELLRGSIWY